MQQLTVLVSIYKASKFIQAKLENLEQQTCFKDATIMLLNCQDLENESKFCNAFAQQHRNVISTTFNSYIRLYSSWNYGIKNAKSQYITNSNVDDLLHPQHWEVCLDYLNKVQECSVVSCGTLVTDIPNQSSWSKWEHCSRLPELTYPDSTAGPCPVWRKSLHDRYGLFGNYRSIGDAKMWERWYAGGEQFHYLNHDYVLYYISPTSLERRTNETGISLRDLDLAEVD